MSSFVETRGGRVFVRRRGAATGTPLVVLHGLMLSGHYFAPIVEELGQTRPVVLVDLPGFGESDRLPPDQYDYRIENQAATVVELVDALGLARFDLLGHSMGGAIALEVAALVGSRVRRIATIAAACFSVPLDALQKALLTPGVGDLLWESALTRGEFRKQMRRQAYRAADISDELIDYFWARFNRPGGRRTALAAARAVAFRGDHLPALRRVEQPTLVVHGEGDTLIPVGNGRRLAEALPYGTFMLIPACGHHPTIERTRLVVPRLQLHFAPPQLTDGRA